MRQMMSLLVKICIKKMVVSGQTLVAGHVIVEKYSKFGSGGPRSRVEVTHSALHRISAGLDF